MELSIYANKIFQRKIWRGQAVGRQIDRKSLRWKVCQGKKRGRCAHESSASGLCLKALFIADAVISSPLPVVFS